MSYLTSGELRQLRSDITPLLSGTVVILRSAEVSDDQGGYNTYWSSIGTVPALVEPMNVKTGAGTETSGETPQAIERWVIVMPFDTDIKAVDRIQSGETYFEIDGVRKPRSFPVTCRVECTEIRAGGQ